MIITIITVIVYFNISVERDPRKRRVKPVSHHLLQLDFMGDSSDDSDFNAEGHNGTLHPCQLSILEEDSGDEHKNMGPH